MFEVAVVDDRGEERSARNIRSDEEVDFLEEKVYHVSKMMFNCIQSVSIAER